MFKARVMGAAMIGAVLLGGCANLGPQAQAEWRPLFDGRTLDGWTPKIAGYPAGSDPLNTFRVRDGAIVVDYADYQDGLKNRFGHLFYKTPFKSYRFSVKYRFVGEPVTGTPKYALYNSGVMIFAQAPQTMSVHQSFPVSSEAQVLAQYGDQAWTTGNVCTPGVNIHMDGAMVKHHCVNSKIAAAPPGVWVELEIDVSPTGVVTQKINGETAMVYNQVELDPKDSTARRITPADGALIVPEGYIALQSEGQPIEFKDIRIRPYD